MYIAIDLGGTNARISGSKSLDNVKFEKIIKFKLQHDFKNDFQRIIEAIKEVAKNNKIKAIGMGTPGTYSDDRKQLLSARNLSEWAGKPFAADFEKEFDCPVFADNDALVASLGEFYYGQNQMDDFLYLTWGTGIGGSNLKTESGKIISEKVDWYKYLNEFSDQCSGLALQQRFDKSINDWTNEQWKTVMDDFVFHISDISNKLNQSDIVLGGGATSKQKERLGGIVGSLSEKGINLHISHLNDEIGLYGAIALVKEKLKQMK